MCHPSIRESSPIGSTRFLRRRWDALELKKHRASCKSFPSGCLAISTAHSLPVAKLLPVAGASPSVAAPAHHRHQGSWREVMFQFQSLCLAASSGQVSLPHRCRKPFRCRDTPQYRPFPISREDDPPEALAGKHQPEDRVHRERRRRREHRRKADPKRSFQEQEGRQELDGRSCGHHRAGKRLRV